MGDPQGKPPGQMQPESGFLTGSSSGARIHLATTVIQIRIKRLLPLTEKKVRWVFDDNLGTFFSISP